MAEAQLARPSKHGHRPAVTQHQHLRIKVDRRPHTTVCHSPFICQPPSCTCTAATLVGLHQGSMTSPLQPSEVSGALLPHLISFISFVFSIKTAKAERGAFRKVGRGSSASGPYKDCGSHSCRRFCEVRFVSRKVGSLSWRKAPCSYSLLLQLRGE